MKKELTILADEIHVVNHSYGAGITITNPCISHLLEELFSTYPLNDLIERVNVEKISINVAIPAADLGAATKAIDRIKSGIEALKSALEAPAAKLEPEPKPEPKPEPPKIEPPKVESKPEPKPKAEKGKG